jgi:UTP--glucose-1-phosphate uridylyltransferase
LSIFHDQTPQSSFPRRRFWHTVFTCDQSHAQRTAAHRGQASDPICAEEAIAASIDTLIFVTGRNKRAIEDHFDNNQELEMALRAKGKDEQADMVKNILPEGVECIFVRQPEQLGLGHAVLCAERAVGNDPFAVLLADDFLTYEGAGVTADLASAFEKSDKTQLSVMEVNGPDISKYGVVVPNSEPGSVVGLVEKPDADKAPSNLASIGRTC